ncbi:MAG: bacitracin ABC transporter permease, partial [Clostridium sp.]
FITALVFFISTIAKNTALAVGVSMILFLGSLPISLIATQLNLRFIVNTFIPYINTSLFKMAPSFEEMLTGMNGLTLNYSFGAIQLAVIALILIAITFIYFNKKDIKN